MEKRKKAAGAAGKSTPLPLDYLKMVGEVFRTNFEEGVEALGKLGMQGLRFHAQGAVYPDEILIAVSLVETGQLAATTVFASTDFDPKASQPTAEDLLSICVDAIGTIFADLLDPARPERLEQVAARALSAMEDVPFEWNELKVDKKRVFVRVDKSNLTLDYAADEWLKRNDPRTQAEIDAEEEETEKLFVTGAGGKPRVH